MSQVPSGGGRIASQQSPLFGGRIQSNISSTVPVLQYVGQGGTIGGSFNTRMSSATITYDIRDYDLPTFVGEVLGYATASGGAIQRVLPKQHPSFPWLFASSVSVQEGLGPTGKRADTGGEIASWKRVRVSVNFETPPFKVAADGAGPEYLRYTMLEVTPATEFLQRQAGTFQFPEGTPNSDPEDPTPMPDTQIGGGGVVQVVNKTRLTFTWVQLPDAGLFNGGGFDAGGRAALIEDGLGKVNDADWHSYPKGTLLLDSWKPIPHSMPANISPGGGVARSWDAQISMLFFDPPSARPEQYRGHNLAPHPSNGLWYRVHQFQQQDTSQYWRYQEYDFEQIFAMNV